MIKVSNFFLLFILSSSIMYAQSPKNSLPKKISEHKEIKAANHLKKELEMKQLTVRPERIADTATFFQNADKRKNKKCSGKRSRKD